MALCKNMGSIDRGLRAFVGLVALVLAFTLFRVTDGTVAGIVAAAAGVIMLLTAAIGMCPLYVPLGVSTCSAPGK